MDLSLIPMDDLIREAESRCNSFICAYDFPKDKNIEKKFYYGKGTWYQAVILASVLQNDVMNNWNGELRVLQRIAEEE